MQTASSSMSRLAGLEYAFSGLPALSALKDFLAQGADDDSVWQTLCDRLTDLHHSIVSLPKDVILVCEPSASDELTAKICQSLTTPSFDTSETTAKPLPFDRLGDLMPAPADDIAWLIASNVYHNAVAYPAVSADHADAPALSVLALFLRNGYLHGAIREQGGAYGGGASFDSNSVVFKFYSYRDPNCQATFEHFNQSIDWLLDNDHDNEKLEEAILGLIAGMDKPGSPAGEAIKSCFSELHDRDEAWQQALRQRLLNVTIDDLKRVAYTYLKDKPHVKATLAPFEAEDVVKGLGFAVKKLS